MASKKQTSAALKSKILKDGFRHFYVGNRKATDKEIKAFIKENIEHVTPDEYTSPELRRKIGQIKGGLERVRKAKGQRISGQYIDGATARAADRAGIDLNILVRDSGAKDLKDLYKKNPGIKESLEAIMSGVGLPMWFSPEKVIDAIKDYLGGEIIVNGETVTKSQAISLVSKTEKDIFQEYGTVAQATKVNFVGKKKMIISLPEKEHYEGEDVENFMETFADHYHIYVSTAKKKKAKKGKGSV